MFREGNYEIVEFSMAPNGMNQFVSPDILPPNFCYALENIIPSPLGTGQARYGTALIDTLSNPEFNIIRAFPFTINGDTEQAILYIGYYQQDTIDDVTQVDSANFNFDSTIPNSYFPDTKVKIVYTLSGQVYTLYTDIKTASVSGLTVTISIENNLLPSPSTGVVINQIWCQFGSIYKYDFTTNTLSSALITNLSIGCVPRASYFQQKMLICNGVNDVMYWDGTGLGIVSEFLLETQANNLTRITGTTFSFTKLSNFDVSKYFIGNSIQVRVDGILTTLTISNVLVVLNLVTITTVETLPSFGANPVALLYQDKPPAFSYIYVANDRIWALGPGAVGLQYRDTNEQLRVYYSYRTNAVTGYGLFNENTKSIPNIAMFDKHNIQDNFEAICQVNGLMAFMGRKKTQVWSGDTPGQGGNFSWSSTLPVGIFNGDLLIELSNDVYFVSQSGIHSLTTLNIARQFSANSDDSVDNIIKSFTSEATKSNANYRKCSSFKYNEGGFAGFKISDNKILSSLFSTKLYSWFYLSGDFRSSNCFMDIGQQFYLFIGNKIFQYADGNDGSQKIYGDQNGQSFIPILWIPALVKFKSRKGFSNKRYELVVNYPSSFFLNENNTIEISILGDSPVSFKLTDQCKFEYRGDLIGQEPLTVLSESLPNDPGFRLRKEYETVNKRLKFSSSSFWVSISGYVMNGPLVFRRIKLFGIGERNA